jgi:hypothetical protein
MRETKALPSGLKVPKLPVRRLDAFLSHEGLEGQFVLEDIAVPRVFESAERAPYQSMSRMDRSPGRIRRWKSCRLSVPSRTRWYQRNIFRALRRSPIPVPLVVEPRSAMSVKSRPRCAQQSCRRLTFSQLEPHQRSETVTPAKSTPRSRFATSAPRQAALALDGDHRPRRPRLLAPRPL